MAVLESAESRVVLLPRHLVGRSRVANTRIPARDVSGEHAVFLWTGERWELRDLGSRNGTWLKGRKLEPGERSYVRAGEQVAFGNPEATWTFSSDAAPSAAAICGGTVREATGEFLALPTLDDPQVIVELDHETGWQLIRDGEVEAAEDGHAVVIDEQTWKLSIPPDGPLVPTTTEMRDMAKVLSSFTGRSLDFAVSADQEYIEVTARVGNNRHALPPRVHHELLLTLARQRLEDRAADVAPSEEGWVYTSDLRKMLGVSANQFYVMSHRCKRELEPLGIDPTQLIEKRRTSHQVRLGVADVTVRSL